MRIGWKPGGDWPGAYLPFQGHWAALFDGEDPFAQRRPLDDKRCAGSFQTKLLKLPPNHTKGKRLAAQRAILSRSLWRSSVRTGGENEGIDHKVIDAFSPAG